MTNKYDWGIYNGIHGIPWERTEKEENTRNQVRYMLNRSLLMFEYHNLPDSLPAFELERLLQSNGFAGITEVNGEIYAFYGGLGGEPDVYNRPTTMVISNPALSYNATLKIGEDLILMKNDTMMLGLIPTFAKYSSIMNENEITMILSSISKRVNNLISVADDNTAESAKKYLKKLEQGDIGYIFESKLFDSLKTNPMNSAGSGNMSELIELQQYLKASMYNEIGLNANYNMKRERLNTSEVEMNSENLYPLVDNMLKERRVALEKINEKYGTNISVEFNSSWDYRVNQGEKVTQEDLQEFDEEQAQDEQDYNENPEMEEQEEQEETGQANAEETEEQEETAEPREEDNQEDKENESQTLDEQLKEIGDELREKSEIAKQSEQNRKEEDKGE